MASGPMIALYNEDHTELVSTWNAGTVKADEPSEVLTVNIWNNKGGTSDVSDLKDCVISVYDDNGSTQVEDVAKDMWVQINVESIDGSQEEWTKIGGESSKYIRANDDSITDFTIKGVKNNGTVSATSNYCTARFQIVAPINSNPGTKVFKIRLTGYYT